MGILDQVVGAMFGGSGPGGSNTGAAGLGGMGGGSPMAGVLMNLLGGGAGAQNAAGAPGAMSGTAPQPGGVPQGAGGLASSLGGLGGGGLPALVGMFEQAGLGHIIQSWIGNGANQPISPDQLRNVLGESRVNDMAGQAGMNGQDFLSELSRHLPQAVNGITPEGRVPEGGAQGSETVWT